MFKIKAPKVLIKERDISTQLVAIVFKHIKIQDPFYKINSINHVF